MQYANPEVPCVNPFKAIANWCNPLIQESQSSMRAVPRASARPGLTGLPGPPARPRVAAAKENDFVR